MSLVRQYRIERDETGQPSRMEWLGDFPPQPKPPCMFTFTKRNGEKPRCKLTRNHKGLHEFVGDGT